MTTFLRFFALLATRRDRDLVRIIEFLQAENRILRSRLSAQVRLTQGERVRLIRLGRPLGPIIDGLVTIVSPGTFRRWLKGKPTTVQKKKRGRPRSPRHIRQLILRLADETSWGYTRIHGELKKLGLTSVSRTTVLNILREAGVDPARRRQSTWSHFLKRHSETLWACDFFSTKIWTLRGRVDAFVLFFIHLQSRQVIIGGVSPKPTPDWVAGQGRTVVSTMKATSPAPRYLLRDRDAKFTREFDAIMSSNGIRPMPLPPRSPNLNAVAERWVGSIRRECLDHFLVFGQTHLQYLVSEYTAFYNRLRPHQGMGNRPLIDDNLPPPTIGRIRCAKFLGGLLRHYYRHAA